MRIDSFDPVTREGLAITNLFWFELAISAVLFVGVMGVLAVAMVRFRARPGAGEPPQVEGQRVLEVIWTVTPALLLAIVAVLMIQTIVTVNAAPSGPGSLRVRVVGHQWWWEYQFPDQGAVTANELHLPVGTPVMLDMESADVIHSYFVPQFGWMRDAVPGKTNQFPAVLQRTGVFEGACNQYCGSEHAWMREWVYADQQDQFSAWVQQQAQAITPSGAPGEQVFLQNTCVSCHAIRGLPAGAQVGPDLTHLGSRRTIGAGVLDNTPENLGRWIRDPQAIKPGVLMPAFQSLSQDDLNTLVSYLESLK